MPPQYQQPTFKEDAVGDLDAGRSGKDEAEETLNHRLSAMEQLDPFEPIERRSIFHRESFLNQFASNKGARSVVFLIVFLAMGLGSTIGVVPAVMTDRYARLNHGYSDEMDCADYDMETKPEACLLGSADAQNVHATGNLVSNVLTFATSSLMGSLSDEHGRRGLLLLGVFLSFLATFMLVLIQLIPSLSPTWYYGATSLTGLVSWIAVALSALSDVMPPQWRAASFGMLLAGMFLGFATAPTLALTMSHLHISMLACVMVAFGFLNALFFFPETLPPEKAALARETRRGQVAGMTKRDRIIWNLKRPAWELSILNRSNFFRLLSLLAFFSGMVTAGDQTLLIYYVEERLGFNDQDVATMFLIVGVLGILSQAVLLKPFIECAGERMVVTFCFIVGALDNFLYGLADEKTLIFVGMACGAVTNMAFPTISAIKANNVDESEQGRIQGALYSVQALASGTGPMAMRYVYHLTVDGAFLGPGSMFVFASTLSLVAACCAYALPKERADSRPSTRAMLRDLYYEDTEVEESESGLFVADAKTPILDAEAGSQSSGSYGTNETQQGTEIQ